MVLPQVIAENPNLWNPDLGLTNCESFSLAYLTIDSNGELWVRSQGCFDISKGMSIVSAWWNKLWRLFSKICREFGGIVLVKSYPPKLFIENYEYQILSPKPVINEEMR